MGQNIERKMAWIANIDAIESIQNADAIEVAVVGGWKCVVKKGEFKANQLAIYISIDSWVPHEVAPFLSKGKEPREFNGVKGERLKTISLRKTLSQGLILPMELVGNSQILEVNEGMDVTEILGIQKWEAPIPTQLQGQVRGTFPSWARKTDQERIQNLSKEFEHWKRERLTFEVTEKLEGSSMSVYLNNGTFGVCSRNMDLLETEGNSFWKVARAMMLEEKLLAFGANLMLQGELIGPGIQGNIYGLKEHEFRLFDVFDIDSHSYMNAEARANLAKTLEIEEVPVLARGINIFALMEFHTIPNILELAEGPSPLAKRVNGTIVEREGLVFKCIENPEISFKAISNKYLLGEKE